MQAAGKGKTDTQIKLCVRAAGLRADEAKSINRSLTMLGMCINARASSAIAHAPYRDSKLTRLLKVCLGRLPSSLLGSDSRTSALLCLRCLRRGFL